MFVGLIFLLVDDGTYIIQAVKEVTLPAGRLYDPHGENSFTVLDHIN